jgi:hypothetical protein
MRKVMTIAIIVLAVVVIACGAVSVVMGQTTASNVTDRLKKENVSLQVFDENAPAGAIVTNAAEAQKAADTLNEHRKKIAPTYSDLLGGKRFDPTNPTQLTYVVGMTLEGQMNMAVMAFGLTTVLTFFGAVLIVIGVVLLIVGIDIFLYHVRPAKKGVTAETAAAANGTA